jgi:hypothetical protein
MNASSATCRSSETACVDLYPSVMYSPVARDGEESRNMSPDNATREYEIAVRQRKENVEYGMRCHRIELARS